MDRYTVLVRNPRDFTLIAVLDQYESLTYTRRWQQPGSFDLVLGDEHPLLDSLAARMVVVEVRRDGVFEFAGVVELIEVELSEEDETGLLWRLSGSDLSAYVSGLRVLPPASQEYDTVTGVAAAAALRYYIDRNGGPSSRSDRRLPTLVIGGAERAVVAGRSGGVPVDPATVGATVTVNARYERALELATDIAVAGEVGYRFSLDADARQVTFEVYEGADLSEGNPLGLPPAVFSIDRDTLRRFSYRDSRLDVTNAVFAAGAGEGIFRTIVEETNPGSIATWGRREEFVDVRDQTTLDGIRTEAKRFLNARADAQSVTFQPLDSAALRYRDGWDVGDIVTARWDRRGIRADLRVSEVAVTLSAGAPPELTVTTGAFRQSLAGLIRERERETETVRIAGSFKAPLLTNVAAASSAVGGSVVAGSVGAQTVQQTSDVSLVPAATAASVQAALDALRADINTQLTGLATSVNSGPGQAVTAVNANAALLDTVAARLRDAKVLRT